MARKDEEACTIPEEADTIQPPRLEDAGLEDCALPIESIMEAFVRAAVISTGPRAISEENEEEEEEEEDEANVDTREKNAALVVEGSSGRKLGEDEESDPEERNNKANFAIDVNDVENQKDVRIVT